MTAVASLETGPARELEAPARNRLIVLDLEGSGAARSLLQRAARWSLRRGRGTDDSAAPDLVLVHGDLPRGFDGVEVRSTADVLTTEQWHECQSWIDAASREVVYGSGRGLFPSARGVHFGELLLLSVQGNLLDFAYLARALAATLGDQRVEHCRIISAEPDRAAALRELAEASGVRSDAWSVPLARLARRAARLASEGKRRLVRLARRGARRESEGRHAPTLPSLTRANVLEVSESTPMAQMFDAMERQYPDLGVRDVLRVQFGGRAGSTRSGNGVTVTELGRPGIIPPRERGRHAGHVARTSGQLRTYRVSKPLAGIELRAPVRTVLEFVRDETFDQLHEHLEFVDRVLDAVAPRLLVVGNDRWWVGQAFVQRARLRGIPSVCVQDGLASDIVYWWWMPADYFAASSPVVADVLRAHGAPKERVALTGQPRYDGLARLRDASRRAELRRELGLDESRTHVLFATQPHHDQEYVRRVVDALLAVPNVHVLLRPHPSEPAAKYDAVIAAHSTRVTSQAGREIFALLASADVLVTEYSTVVLEGAVLGTPAVTANFDGQPPRGTYSERGLAISARTPAQLTSEVARLIAGRRDDKDRRRREEGLAALLGPVDGDSGRRTAAFVASVLRAEGGA